MMQEREPPAFSNDVNYTIVVYSYYIQPVEAKTEEPNCPFPFVQLESVAQDKLPALKSKDPLSQKIQKSANRKPKAKLDLKCDFCSEHFIYQNKLTNHLKNDHPEVEKPFVCSVCPDSYKTSNELNLHLGTKHPNQFAIIKRGDKIYAITKKHQCPHCPKKFSGPLDLKCHIVSHTKEKTYVCDICGSKYKDNKGLVKHKAEEKCNQVIELNLTKKFRCNHCEAAFGAKKSLSRHLRIYHKMNIQPKKELDFTCLFCGYKAPNGTKLQCHNVIHTGEKFECKACKKSYAQKNQLNIHIRRKCNAAKAMGLEPDVRQKAPNRINTEADIPDAQGRFKCSNCVQTFKERQFRYKHERSHGDAFMCEFCPAGFKSNTGLKSHGLKAHLDQMTTFNCNDCGNPYSCQQSLKNHKLICSKSITNVTANPESQTITEDSD